MNFRRNCAITCVVLIHMLTACGDPGPFEYQLTGPTMGTTFSVTVVANHDVDLDALRAQIHSVLDDIDRRMSTYRDDAELARFNASQTTGWQTISPVLCDAVQLGLELGKITDGAFDITVGRLVDMWGFGPRTILGPPSRDNIERARANTGLQYLEADCNKSEMRKLRAGVRVDLSGYAKGHAANEIGLMLSDNGIYNFLVEVGGDIRTQGQKANGEAWRVAIETPDTNGQVAERVIHVSTNAIATSGDYRNFFEFDGQRFSHTIDPRTGRPVTHELASVTVVFDNAAIADAYATALMVLGPDAGMDLAERLHIAAYFLVRDGDVFQERKSTAFAAFNEP